MSRQVELSVLMPVHNGERHLREAVESVLGQSFGGFELLVVDDGSTDSTPHMLEALSSEDDRIRVVAMARRVGVGAALNAGLEHVAAELIARMDADDVAHPDRFALQLQELRRVETLGMLGTQVRLVDDRGRPAPYFDWILPVSHDRCVWELLFGAPFCHPSVMMRTAAVRAVHGYDARFPDEDRELWTRMAFVTRMRNLDMALLDYRLAGPGDEEKRATWNRQAHVVGQLYAERILGRPVAESAVRAMVQLRTTGMIDPSLTDLEVLAASSLERDVLDAMLRQGLLERDDEIAALVADDCQYREAAVLARSAVRP